MLLFELMYKHKHFIIGIITSFSFLLLPAAAFASEIDLEHQITSTSMTVVVWASLILLGLIGIAALSGQRSNLLFGLIVITVLSSTVYLIGSTIYLNNVASSKGPVHWHADTEMWACGTEVDLKNPTGALSNKIGTSTLHEHNDKRIHLEGVVVSPPDASLSKFFRVIGGEITSRSLIIPGDEGSKSYKNGQTCGTAPAEVQVFVYKTNAEKYYTQEKITDPANYIISPQSQVPAGDCIIIEFDTAKTRTDKICRSYQAALKVGRHLKGKAE